jgi:hypothetical protein
MEGELLKDEESTLEAGLLVVGIIIAVAMAILAVGRTMAWGQGRARRAERGPAVGDIGAERHQHISAVAAR